MNPFVALSPPQFQSDRRLKPMGFNNHFLFNTAIVAVIEPPPTPGLRRKGSRGDPVLVSLMGTLAPAVLKNVVPVPEMRFYRDPKTANDAPASLVRPDLARPKVRTAELLDARHERSHGIYWQSTAT
jgi:hypothetical protein